MYVHKGLRLIWDLISVLVDSVLVVGGVVGIVIVGVAAAAAAVIVAIVGVDW